MKSNPQNWTVVNIVFAVVAAILMGFLLPKETLRCWNEPFLFFLERRECKQVEVFNVAFLYAAVVEWFFAGIFHGLKWISRPENRKKVLTFLAWIFTFLGSLSGVIQVIIKLL